MSSEYLLVESREGEKLYVMDSTYNEVGYWINKFLVIVDNYCTRVKNGAELGRYESLTSLETQHDESLCVLTQRIRRVHYSGHWDLKEDEYDVFQRRLMIPMPISEEEYRQTIRKLEDMWTDINSIIDEVENIIDRIRNTNLTEVENLFNGSETREEFTSLLQTLQTLKKRGTTSVRLNFL